MRTVIKEDKEHTIYPGESIFIPQGDKHRAWNKTEKPVQFIEVQTGDYFGEDDIIRYEDDFNRGEFEHLKDWVDIKEEQLANKTDWWKRMKNNE